MDGPPLVADLGDLNCAPVCRIVSHSRVYVSSKRHTTRRVNAGVASDVLEVIRGRAIAALVLYGRVCKRSRMVERCLTGRTL
jgi:hypothetical protein